MNKLLAVLAIAVLFSFSSETSNALELCIGSNKIYAKRNCQRNEQNFNDFMNTLSSRCLQAASENLNYDLLKDWWGTEGINGKPGDSGEKGRDGLAYGDDIQSGTTIFGKISAESAGKTDKVQHAKASFLIRLPEIIDADKIIIKLPGEVLDQCESGIPCVSEKNRNPVKQEMCSGSAGDPKPAPGFLCIYPVYLNNISNLSGAAADLSRYGFTLEFYSHDSSEFAAFSAVWAYTSPADQEIPPEDPPEFIPEFPKGYYGTNYSGAEK